MLAALHGAKELVDAGRRSRSTPMPRPTLAS